MTGLGDSSVHLVWELDGGQVDLLAKRVSFILERRNNDAWLDTKGAAEHLATTPARIHDLVQLRKLAPRRDGRRLLFRRSDLDAYLET